MNTIKKQHQIVYKNQLHVLQIIFQKRCLKICFMAIMAINIISIFFLIKIKEKNYYFRRIIFLKK